jgi:hypothetical protein
MAKTITFIQPGNAGATSTPPAMQRYSNERKKVRFNIAGDAAYPNAGGGLGGYPIAPADLGFVNQIDWLDIVGEVPAGGTANAYFTWNRVTQKMQAVVPSTGAEVANGVDVHLTNVDCAAEGV